jgi:hypothetical protein
MRSILRLPKLPTLKPKVVGILVIAAVLVVVFAVQKSPDGFQNNKTNCFNPVCYANNNPDLKRAFGAGTDQGSAQKLWNHWYWQGIREGRDPCCPPTTTAPPTSTAPSPVLNPTSSPSVKQAEELLVTANNALASGVTELNRWQQEQLNARNKLMVKEQEAAAAAAAKTEAEKGLAAAAAAVKRLQDDLELKKKAVVNAQQTLDNARRAPQQINCTQLPPEQNVDINMPCPACYTRVGTFWTGMPWSRIEMQVCRRTDKI